MTRQVSLTINDSEFQMFIDLLKNIPSAKNLMSKNIVFPTMSKKDILKRVEDADKDIKLGKTKSNNDFYSEFKQW
jgi:hypothetical protein